MKKLLALTLTSVLALSACGSSDEDFVELSGELLCLGYSDDLSGADYGKKIEELYDDYGYTAEEYEQKAEELSLNPEIGLAVQEYLKENCKTEAYLEILEQVNELDS